MSKTRQESKLSCKKEHHYTDGVSWLVTHLHPQGWEARRVWGVGAGGPSREVVVCDMDSSDRLSPFLAPCSEVGHSDMCPLS